MYSKGIVILIATIAAGALAAAAASTGPGHMVAGAGATVEGDIQVSAQSGAAGEDAQGTIILRDTFGGDNFIRAEVKCLAVFEEMASVVGEVVQARGELSPATPTYVLLEIRDGGTIDDVKIHLAERELFCIGPAIGNEVTSGNFTVR